MDPVLDVTAILRLKQKAETNPLDREITDKFYRQDYQRFGEWLTSEFGLLIRPCFLCIYTCEMKDGLLQAQLSISSLLPFVEVTTEIMVKIAAEFGLGDQASWNEEHPPKEGQRAYNVFKTLSNPIDRKAE